MSDAPADEFHQSDRPIGVAVAEEGNGTGSVLQNCADADPLLLKKTRDLQNWAGCHSCGFRINTGDGKDRLRSLHSEWRIVLLCRQCYNRCARGVMCTYCLGEVAGEEERFNCGECSCCIHKDCVLKFGEFPPWSYFDWRNSTVCLDCWLPNKVKKMRDVRLGNGMISDCLGSGRRLMEGGENGVDYSVEKRGRMVSKPHMAFKTREKSFRRALVGKENEGTSYRCGLGEKRRGVDDAELAFQLHRVMNSSPRISRNFGPARSSHVDVKQRRGGKYISSGKMSAFRQRRFVDGKHFSASFNNGYDAKDDNDVDGALKEGQGSSNSSMDSDPSFWKELDLPKPELKFTYVRRKNRTDVGGRSSPYLFKYIRRKSRLRQLISRKYTYLYDRSSYEGETSSAAIFLHSSNETRKFPDSCILALPASMCGNALSRNKT